MERRCGFLASVIFIGMMIAYNSVIDIIIASALQNINWAQWLGGAILGLITMQLMVLVFSSVRRFYHENTQLKISTELLQTKLEAAKVQHFKQEQDTLHWNGFRKFVVKRKVHEGKKKPKGPFLVHSETGQQYFLTKDEISVGRLKTSDIQISHQTMSGMHAKLICKKNELYVEDLMSTNGTRINKETLKPQIRIKLNHKDEVHFGEVGFQVHLPSGENTGPQPGDICSFYLVPHDGKPLPSFEPGQYLTFQFKIPDQAKPIIRCYSLSDSPNPDYYRISVKREFRTDGKPGLSSNYLHDLVQEGDIIDVKAPGGKFYLDMNKQKPIVLIGGGIGITPVMSMLNTLVARKSKRETWFFFGIKNGSEHVFKEHLETIALENDNVHLHVCYSKPDRNDVKGRDYHHAERVSAALFKKLLPSNNYDYLMCGPGAMMESLDKDLQEWGVPKTDIYYEAFGPASVKKPEKPAEGSKQSPASAAIDVKFCKADKMVQWNTPSMTILELAEANGVAIDFGCRAGNCGTCKTAIKAGEVTYVKEIDSKPEAGTCLACISIPKTKLELDA